MAPKTRRRRKRERRFPKPQRVPLPFAHPPRSRRLSRRVAPWIRRGAVRMPRAQPPRAQRAHGTLPQPPPQLADLRGFAPPPLLRARARGATRATVLSSPFLAETCVASVPAVPAATKIRRETTSSPRPRQAERRPFRCWPASDAKALAAPRRRRHQKRVGRLRPDSSPTPTPRGSSPRGFPWAWHWAQSRRSETASRTDGRWSRRRSPTKVRARAAAPSPEARARVSRTRRRRRRVRAAELARQALLFFRRGPVARPKLVVGRRAPEGFRSRCAPARGARVRPCFPAPPR